MAPRVIAGRWKVRYGTVETEIWEEQICISETGDFDVSFGKRKGVTGSSRHGDGAVVFDGAKFAERWTHVDGKWHVNFWTTKQAMESGMPPEDAGYAEWQFSLPYVEPGK